MHHARIHASPRLQRALKVLKEAQGEISTLELMQQAQICAVSAVISELRANGAEINCRQTTKDGHAVFYYTLIKLPELPNASSKID